LAYQVIFHKNAEKGLKSLRSHPALLKKLARLFDELAVHPHNISAKRLQGEWEGCFSYRAAWIRIIYEIENEKLIVYILEIGPRGDIY
jgi:mRNA interferase RelE/StbE